MIHIIANNILPGANGSKFITQLGIVGIPAHFHAIVDCLGQFAWYDGGGGQLIVDGGAGRLSGGGSVSVARV